MTMNDMEHEMRYIIERLRDKNERLEREVQVLRNSLESAEFRIDQELEPRIKSEHRAYDNWATTPGMSDSDV